MNRIEYLGKNENRLHLLIIYNVNPAERTWLHGLVGSPLASNARGPGFNSPWRKGELFSYVAHKTHLSWFQMAFHVI